MKLKLDIPAVTPKYFDMKLSTLLLVLCLALTASCSFATPDQQSNDQVEYNPEVVIQDLETTQVELPSIDTELPSVEMESDQDTRFESESKALFHQAALVRTDPPGRYKPSDHKAQHQTSRYMHNVDKPPIDVNRSYHAWHWRSRISC